MFVRCALVTLHRRERFKTLADYQARQDLELVQTFYEANICEYQDGHSHDLDNIFRGTTPFGA